MNAQHFPKAERGEKRPVMVTLFRQRLLDPGNLQAAVTDVVDGLKRWRRFRRGGQMVAGELCGAIWDDDPSHLQLHVVQQKVTKEGRAANSGGSRAWHRDFAVNAGQGCTLLPV